MCYKSPGPRCHGHAVERRDALKARASKEWEKVREAEKAIDKLAKGPAGYQETKAYIRLETKRGALLDKWKATGNELQEAEAEIDATKGGIDELESKLAQAKANAKTSEDQMQVAHLQARYDAGRDKYRAKAIQYDKENGTVDCRKPSPYGTKEGVELLNKRARKELDAARNAPTGLERDRHAEKAKAVIEQIKHARMTRDYVKRGIADPHRASLAANKAELKTVAKEYAKVRAENLAYYKEWQEGPLKDLNDYKRQQNLVAVPSRWKVGVKKEVARLEQVVKETRRNPVVRPHTESELSDKKHSLEASIRWGEKTDEERAETVRRNNAIAADYGKGPGSWTGD